MGIRFDEGFFMSLGGKRGVREKLSKSIKNLSYFAQRQTVPKSPCKKFRNNLINFRLYRSGTSRSVS
jgi:hypothetical protein